LEVDMRPWAFLPVLAPVGWGAATYLKLWPKEIDLWASQPVMGIALAVIAVLLAWALDRMLTTGLQADLPSARELRRASAMEPTPLVVDTVTPAATRGYGPSSGRAAVDSRTASHHPALRVPMPNGRR
jgi:hypothetical protein